MRSTLMDKYAEVASEGSTLTLADMREALSPFDRLRAMRRQHAAWEYIMWTHYYLYGVWPDLKCGCEEM